MGPSGVERVGMEERTCCWRRVANTVGEGMSLARSHCLRERVMAASTLSFIC